ncbi:MAG: hypothetical protein PVG66_10970 [Chromatiales bacterium]|jgi:hypothetical protein
MKTTSGFMFHKMRLAGLRRLQIGGIALAAILFVSGCATAGIDASTQRKLSVVAVDSHSARVALVQTDIVDDHLRVTGYLKKRYLQRGRIPGQLQIEALASDGTVLEKVISSYHRRNVKSGRAFFWENLTVDPLEVSTVRVTHYGLGQNVD